MRSLNTGFEEFQGFMQDFAFDVLGISETWLQPTIPSDNYMIPGYILLRADRLDGPGGGVAVYVSTDLCFERVELVDVALGVEYISLIVKIKGQKLGLAFVYKPPDVNCTCLGSLFHSLFVDLAVQMNSVMIMGDLNIDLLSNTHYGAKYLRRLMKIHNAVQHVNEPTRVTSVSGSLIDHIISDQATRVEQCGVIDASSIRDHRGTRITDHKLIHCMLYFNKEKKTARMIKYRDFSGFNLEEALHMTSKIDWNYVRNKENVNDIEHFISSNIKSVFDAHAPIVTKRMTKKKAPWRNEEIICLSNNKNKLRKQYWTTRNEKDWIQYKVVRNRLNNLIWQCKKAYFKTKSNHINDSKEFWKCMRQSGIVGNKESEQLPSDININDINKYFSEMGLFYDTRTELENLYKNNKKPGLNSEFTFSEVSVEEVKSAMNEITSRAVGSDEIGIDMIKAVSPYAIDAITYLINKSLSSGEYPKSWKMSLVCPLAKKTCPSNVSHFRPISILPAMSKILEKIAIRQISKFIEEQDILPRLQSGFRKNHGTCTALVNLFDDLFGARDSGKCSSLVMLDYSQAFDSLSHRLLLAKLSFFGFKKEAIDWFRSYLDGRMQVTKVDSVSSLPLVKARGVPQGSCLGPILFTLYTADLSSCVKHCKIHMYADDCQLHISYEPALHEMAIANLNSDLESIGSWSIQHGLKLNPDKCTVLNIASPSSLLKIISNNVQVKFEDHNLSVSDAAKTLGVVLDSELKFTNHVTYVSQRALGRLRGMYRFRSILPEPVKLRLVQSLILPILYYCLPAFGNSISKEDSERMEKMQNTAVRFVYNLCRRDHVSAFRDAANIMYIDTIRRFQTCCLINRVLTERQPKYLTERLVHRGEVALRGTRHDNQLHVSRVRLEIGRKGFSHFGPKMYNDLPCDIKSLAGLKFKNKLWKLI